jgi:hypothetical protein
VFVCVCVYLVCACGVCVWCFVVCSVCVRVCGVCVRAVWCSVSFLRLRSTLLVSVERLSLAGWPWSAGTNGKR